MKRSQINQYIDEALCFFEKNHFYLPGWVKWTPEMWKSKGDECAEIFSNNLGWDITDFGGNDFLNQGLTLVTIRNGNLSGNKKVYCEKIMYVRQGQITPLHFHWLKTEDIINRGGGTFCMRMWKADKNEEPDTSPLTVQIDGITTEIIPGETLRLNPGQSICYEPYLYHTFWAENGPCMIGEISTVNDDLKDNRFHKASGRFPAIEEDVQAKYLLCNEYKK